MRWFCCASPYNFSVTKPPVVVADISPDIQCVGVNVTADFDASYVPLGTLNNYVITWGDGNSAAGAWGPPGPLVNAYAAAGTYNIRITLTDTLGHSSSTTYQVLIVDCALGSVLADYMYALSQTTGPWLRDMTVAVPAWVQHINGLSGNYLNGRDLKIDPHRKHLPVAGRHVWITTQAGPAKSIDNMDNWSQLYSSLPEPQNADGGGTAKAALNWYTICFQPLVRDTVFIHAGTATRAWVYFTTDGGLTWDSWQVRR